MRQRIWHVLQSGIQSLYRSPGFALAAVLTLGIGIGANSLLFSIVNSILIQPLEYRDPDRLVVIREVIPQVADRYPTLPANAGHFERWRDNAQSIEEVAALSVAVLNLTGVGEPGRLEAARVSWNLFTMLGIPLQLGRSFLPEEDAAGRDQVVILTDELWRDRFQRNPEILGNKILLNGNPYQVVGVLVSNFYFPRSAELGELTDLGSGVQIFVPMGFRPNELEPVGDHNFAVVARLRESVSVEQATSELNALQKSIAGQLPVDLDLEIHLIPLQSQLVREVEGPLWMLLAAVVAVLLIGCVNLANLLLARASARQGEVALRMALGARPGWVMAQFLAESLILALLGGGLGFFLAYFGKDLLLKTVPLNLPRLAELSLDLRVVGFATMLSLCTGLFFGILPALRVARIDPQQALKSIGQRGSESRRSMGARSWLVALEVALSTVLLVVSGLLTTSLINLTQVDKGFVVENISTVNLQIFGPNFASSQDRVRFYDEVIEQVSRISSVQQVVFADRLPLAGQSTVDIACLPNDTRPLLERPLANYRWVSSAYFETLGISLQAGRTFREGDRQQEVALVSEGLARKIWQDRDPLGQEFWRGDGEAGKFRVVGVVPNIRSTSLWEDPADTVYLPYWNLGPSQGSLIIHSRIAAPASSEIRKAIWEVDPEMPVTGLVSLEQTVVSALEMQRFQAWLVGSFAVVALLLASFGIYAVISQIVGLRTREIGVRMALGAARKDILKLVIRQGMVPSLAGLAVGSVGAIAVSRTIRHLLFGVSPNDFTSLLLMVGVLLIVALAASYFPARRASRFDPMDILRS